MELRRGELGRAVGLQIRRAREEAGVSRAALGRSAAIDPSAISRFEAARREPSLAALLAIAIALDGALQVRLVPGSGSPLRDRFQARMVECLIRSLHPQWAPFPEVAVVRPGRGSIDLVIADPSNGLLIAVEVHSELRGVELVLRRAAEKAAALATTELAAYARASGTLAISRLLVLRNTAATREVVTDFAATIGAAHPTAAGQAVAALRAGGSWPGPAVVWMNVRGRDATLLAGPPLALRRAPVP